MTTAMPLNSGLYRVHRVFYIAIAAFAIIMLWIGIPVMGIGFLPIGVAHWYAVKGARDGKNYGKILSRIIGSLWLIGFPIGTALGIYVWSQTGAKWKASSEATSASALSS